MTILTIRTDKPEAEIGLFEGEKEIDYKTWQAHRELSTTILKKIEELLKKNENEWKDVAGIVCFKGPGSFTGLRIGIAVANSLALGLKIPVVGTSGEKWLQDGIGRLKKGENESIALPEYGREPRTTKPKK